MSDVKIWKGNWTFILAAAGSAVGLGNIWKFPYMVGSNGGSAFVIVYLICILIIGLPVMASEILIGKYGRKSPINSLKKSRNKIIAFCQTGLRSKSFIKMIKDQGIRNCFSLKEGAEQLYNWVLKN